MNRAILCAVCVFMCSILSAQKQQIHLKIIQPSIEYQFEIRNNLIASIDLGIGIINLSYNRASKFETYISTFSNITLKKLYNPIKVMNKNANLLSQSGNYYGLRCLSYNKNLNNKNESNNINLAIGPVWGVQRYYKSFYYQLEIGLGYHNGYELNGIAPLARFCVGKNLYQW